MFLGLFQKQKRIFQRIIGMFCFLCGKASLLKTSKPKTSSNFSKGLRIQIWRVFQQRPNVSISTKNSCKKNRAGSAMGPFPILMVAGSVFFGGVAFWPFGECVFLFIICCRGVYLELWGRSFALRVVLSNHGIFLKDESCPSSSHHQIHVPSMCLGWMIVKVDRMRILKVGMIFTLIIGLSQKKISLKLLLVSFFRVCLSIFLIYIYMCLSKTFHWVGKKCPSRDDLGFYIIPGRCVFFNENCTLPTRWPFIILEFWGAGFGRIASLKLIYYSPKKWWFPPGISFSRGLFSGDMLFQVMEENSLQSP